VKKSLFVFFYLIPVLLFAQDSVRLANGRDYDPDEIKPFLQKLRADNEYVISFRTRLTDRQSEDSDYFILTQNQGKLQAYTFLKQSVELRKLTLSTVSLQLAWKTFMQNELFAIRDEKDIPNFCPEKYQIYNSYTYEFIILSPLKMKRLSYYSPEYYDTACYGMEERKKIINSVSVVNYIMNNNQR
jgi:hypothetical protein